MFYALTLQDSLQRTFRRTATPPTGCRKSSICWEVRLRNASIRHCSARCYGGTAFASVGRDDWACHERGSSCGRGCPSTRYARPGHHSPRSGTAWLAMSEGAKRPSRMVRKRGFEPPLPCGNKLLRLNRIAADHSGPRNIGVRCSRARPFSAGQSGVSRKVLQVLAKRVLGWPLLEFRLATAR